MPRIPSRFLTLLLRIMSIEKIQDTTDIFFGLIFIGIVPTVGKDCKLASGKMAIKCDSLFDVKDETPVWIEHKSWTCYRWQ
jgi:hypothetical protein